MAIPSPVPVSLPVSAPSCSNGSKICCRKSSLIPMPLSLIIISALQPVSVSAILLILHCILPPSEVNLIELERILIKICEILNLSTYILHGLMPLKDILKSIFLLSSCIFIQFSIFFTISIKG